MIFEGRTNTLHWLWDTGLLGHINQDPVALAAELTSRITPLEKAEWQKGSIEDWVMDCHRLAQTVAYGDLGSESPAPITPSYEQQATLAIDLQLEKAGIRLAYLLNTNLMPGATGQKIDSKAQAVVSRGNSDVRVGVNTNSGV